MLRARSSALAVLGAWLIAGAPCAAKPADSSSTPYALITPPSSLSVGCQGPCACPLVVFPTFGSFVLVPAGSDPLYTYYDVERYVASFNNGPGAVAIVGSGRYKIGGEFALVQELTLDLQIEGRPTEHFDSGLQPVTVPFPKIDVSCAVHGFYCYDSVLVVAAKPSETADAPTPSAGRTGLQLVRPNPFERRTSITFSLDRPGRVDLAVFDLGGRRVSALATGTAMPAGQRTLVWDGRRDDGAMAPAGIYWVLMRWDGGVDRRRIVKLD